MNDYSSFHLCTTADPAMKSWLYCKISRGKSLRQCQFYKRSSMSATRQVQQDRLNTSSICTALSPASALEIFWTSHTAFPLFPTCPSLPVVGYHTYTIHHTGTCYLQENNFGLKVLKETFLRVCEPLLFFTRLQMHRLHGRRNTRSFSEFSLSQHAGTQPDPAQHTLTSTLCNSTAST